MSRRWAVWNKGVQAAIVLASSKSPGSLLLLPTQERKTLKHFSLLKQVSNGANWPASSLGAHKELLETYSREQVERVAHACACKAAVHTHRTAACPLPALLLPALQRNTASTARWSDR